MDRLRNNVIVSTLVVLFVLIFTVMMLCSCEEAEHIAETETQAINHSSITVDIPTRFEKAAEKKTEKALSAFWGDGVDLSNGGKWYIEKDDGVGSILITSAIANGNVTLDELTKLLKNVGKNDYEISVSDVEIGGSSKIEGKSLTVVLSKEDEFYEHRDTFIYKKESYIIITQGLSEEENNNMLKSIRFINN